MFKEILLAVDLNDESSWKKALPLAIEHTRLSNGTLHILTVIPDFGMSIVGQFFPEKFEHGMTEKAMEALHNFVKEHVPDDINFQHIVGQGTIYQEIIELANKIKADLIIVSSGRDDLKDFLLGPNAARITRHASCSVLVVR